MNRVVLGIDTSNYKTSVALADEQDNILCNLQEYLEVKKGERGLRQSVALFQHVNKLPALLEQAFSALAAGDKICAVAVSEKPRPVEGSYMPVFNAGVCAARTVAAALGVPCFRFSHQEGHVEAVRRKSRLRDSKRLISFHFSGGTTEALLVEGDKISIIGGSKDIAFGQVLDRIGVAMGMDFPCGQQMDEIARKTVLQGENILPQIKCSDGMINLSGIETKGQRSIGKVSDDQLCAMVLQRVGQAVCAMTKQLCAAYGTDDVLFAGGVSASSTLRAYLQEHLRDVNFCFGDPALSADNAVGTAFLGGKKLWD